MSLGAGAEGAVGRDREWRLAAGALWASAMLWDAMSSYVIQTSTLGSWRYEEINPFVAPIVAVVSKEITFLLLAPVGVIVGLWAIWRFVPQRWLAVVVELALLGWVNNALCCSQFVYHLVH